MTPIRSKQQIRGFLTAKDPLLRQFFCFRKCFPVFRVRRGAGRKLSIRSGLAGDHLQILNAQAPQDRRYMGKARSVKRCIDHRKR